jgi:glycosyltransferase involved in cell wall biosynthesis
MGGDPTGCALLDSDAVELPSITIVTPCLNAAETLEECLRSVREQDYPRLEHVVVDGGSTDGRVQILEAAEGIQFISEPDEGRPDAANKGVRLATGEVIGFLNADDRYEPGALRAVGEALAANPAAMRQFREHEEVARLRGNGQRVPVAAKAVMSRLIVLVDRVLGGR